MKKAILIAGLASMTFGSISVANAAMQVTNVKRKYISLKDSQDIKLEKGSIVAIMDEDGERVGEARLLKVNGKRAQAYLIDGDVDQGYSVRAKTDGDDIDDEMTDSDNGNGGASPYSRGQAIRSSRSRAKRAGKIFAIESEVIRDLVGMANVKAHYRVLNSTSVGIGYLRYNVDLESTASVNGQVVSQDTMTVSGSTISLIGTTWFNGTAFSQGFYARGEVGRIKLSIDADVFTALDFEGVEITGDATGLHGHANLGYHWQWSNLYTNLYAGVQYVNLSLESNDPTIASQSSSATGFDLGFNMGLSF